MGRKISLVACALSLVAAFSLGVISTRIVQGKIPNRELLKNTVIEFSSGCDKTVSSLANYSLMCQRIVESLNECAQLNTCDKNIVTNAMKELSVSWSNNHNIILKQYEALPPLLGVLSEELQINE